MPFDALLFFLCLLRFSFAQFLVRSFFSLGYFLIFISCSGSKLLFYITYILFRIFCCFWHSVGFLTSTFQSVTLCLSSVLFPQSPFFLYFLSSSSTAAEVYKCTRLPEALAGAEGKESGRVVLGLLLGWFVHISIF